jgi:hypothetical protein
VNSSYEPKQSISIRELSNAIDEITNGQFEADLGGHIIKKRVRFQGKGKSKSGRTIICYRKDDRAIFIHGFAKNEKPNLSPKELKALKPYYSSNLYICWWFFHQPFYIVL